MASAMASSASRIMPGPLADKALGHVAEGVVGIEFAYQLGLLHGLAMAALLAIESAQRRMGQGKVRLTLGQRFQAGHRLVQFAGLLQFNGFVVQRFGS